MNPVVDEERMRPGHWLESVLRILLCHWWLGDRKDIRHIKTPFH